LARSDPQGLILLQSNIAGKAFSSEVDTGSREENASKQEPVAFSVLISIRTEKALFTMKWLCNLRRSSALCF
jgi:hypothetical protein